MLQATSVCRCESKPERKERQKEPGDHEVGDLHRAVGAEGESARPGARRVREGTPAYTEHEVVLEGGQREQDGTA